MDQNQLRVRNNVNIIGNGSKVLMMSHGFGCDQNMFRFVTPAFEKDYKIVLFDHVGSGASDTTAYHPDKYGTLSGYAEDIVEICTALELRDVVFIGHSVSATIGVLAYNQEPSIFSKLVMICPSPRYINDDQYIGGFELDDLEELMEVMENNYEGWANFLAPVVLKNQDKPLLVQELEESFKKSDPEISQTFAKATFFSDNRKDLSKVRVPALILQTRDDSIAPEQVGEYVHQQISGSTFLKLKATGHCPHMTHPDETIEAIRKFLVA